MANTPAKDTAPAEQEAGKPAPAPRSATAAGEDGTDRILSVTGMLGDFGPVTIGEGDAATQYTITREGTRVAGPHVAAVREAAKYNKVQLKSAKAPDDK